MYVCAKVLCNIYMYVCNIFDMYVCNIFDINYHLNTAHINAQGCRPIVLTHSHGELNCDQLHNYYNYFHLCHYSLLTSTHKPVLARAPSSILQMKAMLETCVYPLGKI